MDKVVWTYPLEKVVHRHALGKVGVLLVPARRTHSKRVPHSCESHARSFLCGSTVLLPLGATHLHPTAARAIELFHDDQRVGLREHVHTRQAPALRGSGRTALSLVNRIKIIIVTFYFIKIRRKEVKNIQFRTEDQ